MPDTEKETPRPAKSRGKKRRATYARRKRYGRPGPHLLGRLVSSVLASAAIVRRAEAVLARAAAAYLTYLMEGELYLELGYRSLGDLARDLLEIEPSTASERVRLHKVLSRSRVASDAFLAGRIGVSHVIVLAPVLNGDPVNDAAWIEKATELSVVDMRKRMAEARPDTPVEKEGSAVSFTCPLSFVESFQQMMELCQKVLGYDASKSECMRAILAEAGFAGGGAVAEENGGDAGDDGAGDAGDTGEQGSAAPTPKNFRLVSVRHAEIARAKEALLELKIYMKEVRGLIERGAPSDPWDAVTRLTQLHCLEAPRRILLARLMRSLDETHAIVWLGLDNLEQFIEQALGICPRSAKNLVEEGYLYDRWPQLERAVGCGEIGTSKAFLISHVAGSWNVRMHIERAKELPYRDFLNEVRFLDLLQRLDRSLASRFSGPLPQPGLEEALRDKLLALGETAEAIDATLASTGLADAVPDESTDPAENPVLMRRLELLLDRLAGILCDEPLVPFDTGSPRVRKTSELAVRGRVCFHAQADVAADIQHATTAIREQFGEHLDTWVVFGILFAHVCRVWKAQDPARIPIHAAILERDAYHCQFPGCSSREGLHVHHIEPLSQGGPDVPSNTITLCWVHHLLIIHAGYARVWGTAPHDLHWELGVRPGHPPLRRYRGHRCPGALLQG